MFGKIRLFALAYRGGHSGRGRVRQRWPRSKSRSRRRRRRSTARRPLSVSAAGQRSSDGRIFWRIIRRRPNARLYRESSAAAPQIPVDNSRAPARAKPDPKAVAPTTSIVVMGDGMADWLAYGLEDAFSDSPEVAHRPQEQDSFRPVALRGQKRSRLVARGARYPRAGESQLRGHDARRQRPPEHPRARSRQGGRQERQGEEEQDKNKRRSECAQNKDQADDAGSADDRRARTAARQKAPTASSNFAATNGRRSIRNASTKRSRPSRARACRCSGSACRRSAAPDRPPTRSISTISIARAPSAPASIYIDVWDGFVDEAGKYSNYRSGLRRPDAAACVRATASISPSPARASSRIMSSAKSAAT